MAEAFGPDRPAAVCRELTKTYEEVRRGALADLARWAADQAPVNHAVTANGVQHLADAPAIQALKCAPRIGLIIIERLKGVSHADLARRSVERLKAIPYATMCIDCQETVESR